MNEGTTAALLDREDDRVEAAAFRAGEREAFDRLARKYRHRVFNLCYRFFGDYEEANDAAQETWIKVYRALGGFRGEAAFSTWLYRIAVNTCKNRVSSLAYRIGKSMERIDPPAENDQAVPREIRDEASSPLQALERQERNRRIQKALNSLAAEDKAVIILRDLEGLSYEEAAEISGLNLGTLKSKLARAREKLRVRLQGVI